MAPMVVTLAVDEATQAAWDGLRRRWFPPERLVVDAHVTLFHALPGSGSTPVVADLEGVAAGVTAFTIAATGVRSLGHGVALRVRAASLDRLHADLSERWRPWLTAQDARRLDAHVTIQNKGGSGPGSKTLPEVAETFQPTDGIATGLRCGAT